MDARELGIWGEEKAAAFLRRKGYQILECNFRCRQGEIDIIAQKRDIVAFVEVKLRKSADFAQAREFVTAAKQRKIIQTARLWMGTRGSELQPRFDVIEIYAPYGERTFMPKIQHIENAFW